MSAGCFPSLCLVPFESDRCSFSLHQHAQQDTPVTDLSVYKRKKENRISYLDRRGGVSERHRLFPFLFLFSFPRSALGERRRKKVISHFFISSSSLLSSFLPPLKKKTPALAMADEAAAKLAEASVSVSFSFRCFDLLRWRESERQRERKGKRERERGKQTFECSPRRRKKNSD